MSQLLAAKNLYKTYGVGQSKCDALKNVSLDVHEGEFLVIRGASGSGKSTLIHLLAAMIEPTNGDVFYCGKSLTEMSKKEQASYRGKEVGFLFQDGYLIDYFNILQNTCLPGYPYTNKKKLEERARELLEQLGLGEKLKNLPGELSGGQRQRAALARSCINSPKVLFLDEPTGSLDSESGSVVMDLISDMNKKGQTIVMVTHDDRAASFAQRTITINDGLLNVEV